MNRLTAIGIGNIPVKTKGAAYKKAVVAASMKTDCHPKKKK